MNRANTFVDSIMEQMEKNSFTQGEARYIAETLKKEVERNRKRVEDNETFAVERRLSFR